MDNRSKICVCYVISTLLITTFIYSLVSTYILSLAKLERLQYEVEEITKVILGRNPDDALLPQIDSYVKKRTQGLWDELMVIKRKLDLVDSDSTGGGAEGGCGLDTKPTQMVDVKREEPSYSMDSLGASIVKVEDTPLHPTNFFLRFFGIKHNSNHPGRILEPSMQLGHCYAFRGNESMFVIKLSHKIIIQSLTVEHISAHMSLTGDISNAPKDFHVYGIENLQTNNETLLGTLQYDNSLEKRAQTFLLSNTNPYSYCKIKVSSNHGNEHHTCIYRIAVHGKRV